MKDEEFRRSAAPRPPPSERSDVHELSRVRLKKLREIACEVETIAKGGGNEYIASTAIPVGAARRANLLLGSFLSELGIVSRRTFSSLFESEERRHYMRLGLVNPHTTLSNMRHMLALEREGKGVVRWLYNQRGVRNFGRFDESFWLRQYREKDLKLPSMVLIVPSGLSESYMTEASVYGKLQDRLAQLKRPHLLRYIEVRNPSEMLRTFSRLDNTHNKDGTTPISAVLFDGESMSERLYLARKRTEKLWIKDVRSMRFKSIFRRHLQKTFAEHPLFVFGSCMTAPGIALALKEVMGKLLRRKIRAIASNYTVTQFADLSPSLQADGSLVLNIDSLPYDRDGEEQPRYEEL